MAAAPELAKPQRLVSLDAYRGFVMVAMVSGGLGLSAVARNFPDSETWSFLDYQFSHVPWTGCSFWDLIQPSFMFIVGVAMPYSLASRRARGDGETKILAHVIYRALILILLGILLRSNHSRQTNFTFEDVVTQIGLGYVFVFLLLDRTWRTQALATAAILIGYWLLFAFWPVPGPEVEAADLGIPADWNRFTGFAAHWNKYENPAGVFDQWFLNLFPRPELFVVNGGGYQTLSFIPSMGTMAFGVMTGTFLRSSRSLPEKFNGLVIAGIGCLMFGMVVDGHIWPIVDWQWSIAPIVKRIWSPSWAVFSTGWTLLMLAGFLWAIDMKGLKRWAFPFVVVGMNSVAMYVMAGLIKGWAVDTIQTHLGQDLFDATYGPIYKSLTGVGLLWLICFWMYRRKIFIRI
jgi:predicted acyltransferase